MKKLCCVSILFFIMIYGCALTGYGQPEGMKALLFAKNEIVSLAEQYEIAYQNASVTAQINWQEKIDPLFIQIEEVLNKWEFFLNIGEDPTDIRNRYILIRNAILQNLVEIKEG